MNIMGYFSSSIGIFQMVEAKSIERSSNADLFVEINGY
jgi:hypothetical protein